MGASLEVAHVFRAHGAKYREQRRGRLPPHQLRAMWAIETCRTAALGGHVWVCDACGQERIAYNACRNRHCPQCQHGARERWLEKRREELLPVGYFHVVFTLPGRLRPLARRNPRIVYDLLFDAASQSLLELAADPRHLGAQLGFVAILHTWGQTLIDHPHLHCLVPGGGLSLDGETWVPCRRGFLLPVRALSRLFRGKLLAGLKAAWKAGTLAWPEGESGELPSLIARLYRHDWMVYSQPPVAGAEKVLEYLAQYVYRVAISNRRLVALHDDEVAFSWKDYAHGGRRRVLRLPAAEFLRRFLLHVLPPRFVRIRSYGFLAHRRRRALARCHELLRDCPPESAPALPQPPGISAPKGDTDPLVCPACRAGRLVLVQMLPPCRRSPRRHPAGRDPP